MLRRHPLVPVYTEGGPVDLVDNEHVKQVDSHTEVSQRYEADQGLVHEVDSGREELLLGDDYPHHVEVDEDRGAADQEGACLEEDTVYNLAVTALLVALVGVVGVVAVVGPVAYLVFTDVPGCT